jgi:hypothetical protein
MITTLWREVSDQVAGKVPPDRNWVGFSTLSSLEATKTLDGIRPVMNERLRQAIRIQEAIVRGATANEVRAEQQRYLESLPEWNAALQEQVLRISRAKFEFLLLPDGFASIAPAFPCPDSTVCSL